jgi:hypothetical protein
MIFGNSKKILEIKFSCANSLLSSPHDCWSRGASFGMPRQPCPYRAWPAICTSAQLVPTFFGIYTFSISHQLFYYFSQPAFREEIMFELGSERNRCIKGTESANGRIEIFKSVFPDPRRNLPAKAAGGGIFMQHKHFPSFFH